MDVRNRYRLVLDGTVELTLTRGQVCLIDVADLPLVGQYRWHASGPKRGTYYAATELTGRNSRMRRRYTFMHALIAGVNSSYTQQTDHINGNTLDNRRSNLRSATPTQNLGNKSACRNNRTGYKGVWFEAFTQRYRACVEAYGTRHWLGRFDTAEEAAEAYNAKAREVFGDFARLNPLPDREEVLH